jgi:hypothetical protein
MAYFGSVYANRSLGLLFDSLAALGQEQREQLRLYVFTGQTAAMHEEVEARQLWDVVFVLPERDYCEFLQSLDEFDVLIVNDADKRSRGELNPYLPSKLSDYAASRTPILAIVEEGSELSRRAEPTYRCTLQERSGFVEQMLAVIGQIVSKKQVDRRSLPPGAPAAGEATGLAGLKSVDIDSLREYERWLQRLRDVVAAAVPADATLLVVSKGDSRLLALNGCRGRHFPQTPGGEYVGYHPRDSQEAIAHLEDLRARGAEYLLLPSTAFWWLEFYDGFRRHLETSHRVMVSDPHAGVLFRLQGEPVPASELDARAMSLAIARGEVVA